MREGHARVMIDCGADWLGRLKVVDPTAIVLTHAHSDHASGLGQGACCPVYATEETWSLIERFPLADRHVIEPRRPFRIGRISFETFPVEHSLLAPTVGYRVTEGRVAFFQTSPPSTNAMTPSTAWRSILVTARR